VRKIDDGSDESTTSPVGGQAADKDPVDLEAVDGQLGQPVQEE